MYIAALVIPVPDTGRAAYQIWAERSARIFREYGCQQVIDVWEDFIPRGKLTDFFRAVDAAPNEKIAISWQIWPDKATLDAAEQRMHADGVLETANKPPFDSRRLIIGCFVPLGPAPAP